MKPGSDRSIGIFFKKIKKKLQTSNNTLQGEKKNLQIGTSMLLRITEENTRVIKTKKDKVVVVIHTQTRHISVR